MKEGESLPSVHTGLLIQQGGCLPPQVMDFLAAAETSTPNGTPEVTEDTITFYVLPGSAVQAAVSQVGLPTLGPHE